MVTHLSILFLLMSLILSVVAMNMPPSKAELNVALQEMQTANYFSFVMLINMYPLDRIPGNVTFLMPNDRILSQNPLPEDAVYHFLLRHTIPTPLLFDHLEHFPTGSIIPTSEPGFMLNVSNNGRKSFYLNNVQIISPNICTAGTSIRCHGIKGELTEPESNRLSPTCSPPRSQNATAPTASPKDAAVPAASPTDAAASASPPSPMMMPSPSPPLPPTFVNQIPTAAPPLSDPANRSRTSGSLPLFSLGLLRTLIPSVILTLATFQMW